MTDITIPSTLDGNFTSPEMLRTVARALRIDDWPDTAHLLEWLADSVDVRKVSTLPTTPGSVMVYHSPNGYSTKYFLLDNGKWINSDGGDTPVSPSCFGLALEDDLITVSYDAGAVAAEVLTPPPRCSRL